MYISTEAQKHGENFDSVKHPFLSTFYWNYGKSVFRIREH
jgi:hypothetical protein